MKKTIRPANLKTSNQYEESDHSNFPSNTKEGRLFAETIDYRFTPKFRPGLDKITSWLAAEGVKAQQK